MLELQYSVKSVFKNKHTFVTRVLGRLTRELFHLQKNHPERIRSKVLLLLKSTKQ